MASIFAVDKTPAVPAVAEKVNGATLKLTRNELDFLKVGLEYAYKAHKHNVPSYYVNKDIAKLYKTVKGAYEGKTQYDVDTAEKQEQINRMFGVSVNARTF